MRCVLDDDANECAVRVSECVLLVAPEHPETRAHVTVNARSGIFTNIYYIRSSSTESLVPVYGGWRQHVGV